MCLPCGSAITCHWGETVRSVHTHVQTHFTMRQTCLCLVCDLTTEPSANDFPHSETNRSTTQVINDTFRSFIWLNQSTVCWWWISYQDIEMHEYHSVNIEKNNNEQVSVSLGYEEYNWFYMNACICNRYHKQYESICPQLCALAVNRQPQY